MFRLDRGGHGRLRDGPQGGARGDELAAASGVARDRLRLRAGRRARLREERREAPRDLQWMVNPREDVEATLREAAERGRGGRASSRDTYAREGDPADAILDVAEERTPT